MTQGSGLRVAGLTVVVVPSISRVGGRPTGATSLCRPPGGDRNSLLEETYATEDSAMDVSDETTSAVEAV